MNVKTSLALALLSLLATCPAVLGTEIYSESFEYGSSDIGFNTNSLGGWTSSSGVLKYDADGGLDVAAMGGETGGSMWLDFNAVRSATDSSINYNFSSLSFGDTVWFATLFQYVPSTNDHIVTIEGGAVSDLGFKIDASGNVIVRAANPGQQNDGVGDNDTGVDATNGTYLMLLRATIGANSYNNSGTPDSTIDFWFDPADASSESALGSPDWSSSGGSKFGRSTDIFTQIVAQPSQDGRIDEIRLGTTLADVVGLAVPEPTSVTLLAVSLLGIMGLGWRRRRR